MNSSPSGTGASEVGWQDPELRGAGDPRARARQGRQGLSE